VRTPVSRQVYDLSVPILHATDWYTEPGTEPVVVREVGSIEREGWRSSWLGIMVLNGTTYLETAAHVYADAPAIDQIPPERLITRAFVVRVAADGQQLLPPERELSDFEKATDAILLHCGWDSHLNLPDYYHASPYFSRALQGWLLAHRPAIVGGDMLSFDHPADAGIPFIKEFFRGGGMILCPLVGLARLPPQVTLCAAPLRLVGASAAPCRALAW
jgi:arylformamidase